MASERVDGDRGHVGAHVVTKLDLYLASGLLTSLTLALRVRVNTRNELCMPAKRKARKTSPAPHANGVSDRAMKDKSLKGPMAVTSSLHNIHISPRAPKSSRDSADAEDDVEMSLLGEDERRRAVQDLEDNVLPPHSAGKKSMSKRDKRAMVLLCVLCECLEVCNDSECVANLT
jgi:hypothetical protein